MSQDDHEEFENKIVKGLELVYERLIEFKKAKNSPLAVMRDGKIVYLNPHDMSEMDIE